MTAPGIVKLISPAERRIRQAEAPADFRRRPVEQRQNHVRVLPGCRHPLRPGFEMQFQIKSQQHFAARIRRPRASPAIRRCDSRAHARGRAAARSFAERCPGRSLRRAMMSLMRKTPFVLQQAAEFRQRSLRPQPVMRAVARDHQIEAARREGQVLNIGQLRRDVAQAALTRQAPAPAPAWRR